MLNFFKDVLNLGYLKGGYEDSPQESKIKELLGKHNYVEVPKGSTLRYGQFIYQPNGNNNSPDFIVNDLGKVYSLECKSVKKGAKPVYNGGLPKVDYIYIFCSGKYDQTTIYYGKDIVPPEVRDIYERLLKKLNIVLDEFKQEFINCEENNRGFGYFLRHMYIQAGKKQKTDYFTHKDRNKCEENVFNTFR
jgi:hypothetical protein